MTEAGHNGSAPNQRLDNPEMVPKGCWEQCAWIPQVKVSGHGLSRVCHLPNKVWLVLKVRHLLRTVDWRHTIEMWMGKAFELSSFWGRKIRMFSFFMTRKPTMRATLVTIC